MWVLLPVCLAVLFYLLYITGHMPVKSMSALVFVGSLTGRNCCTAEFTGCTGTVRRVIRCGENCRFTLDPRLSKGSVQAAILNRKGLPVAELTEGLKTADVRAAGRYTLLLAFTSASGSFSLHWEDK